MSSVISILNAPHYSWGNNCDGWKLLENDSLSIIQECMPEGTIEKKHYHRHAQQMFYVLTGTAVFDLDGQQFILQVGESIHVPPGMPHSITNPHADDLQFLLISHPRVQGDRVEL